MRRRLFGAVLCLLLLPVLGTARVLWSALRAAAWRPRGLILFGGLAAALSTTNSASLIAPNGVGPMGHMIPYAVTVTGLLVVWHGVRSPELRTLWRHLR